MSQTWKSVFNRFSNYCLYKCRPVLIRILVKITIFYIAYFTFLAGLFMASISVMKTTVNDDKPRLQTRLQIPGLHALPKLDPMNDAQSSRLGDNDGVAIKYDPATEGDNQVYVDILTGIKSDYASQDGGPADFSFSSLGDCGQAPYGYDSNSPCVWIRLNKVLNRSHSESK